MGLRKLVRLSCEEAAALAALVLESKTTECPVTEHAVMVRAIRVAVEKYLPGEDQK